jgi:hypothetical protein
MLALLDAVEGEDALVSRLRAIRFQPKAAAGSWLHVTRPARRGSSSVWGYDRYELL